MSRLLLIHPPVFRRRSLALRYLEKWGGQEMDYYAILGVSPDADEASIRRAFRTLARRYHPDAGEGSSPEKFRLLVQAYETLSDPAQRCKYDESRMKVRRPVFVEPMVSRPAPAYQNLAFRFEFAAYSELRSDWDDLFDMLFQDFFNPPRFRW